MKLVEPDLAHSADDRRDMTLPPRPEHRRVYISFIFTFSVLAATVATVFYLFPARDNELLTVCIEAHQHPGTYEIKTPNDQELLAWGVGVVGPSVPFPTNSDGMSLLGVRSIKVLRRPVAMANYRMPGGDVSYFVMRAHDAPSRRYQRQEGDLQAVSWRGGRWTLIAVGPAASRSIWGPALGVP